MWLTWLGAWDSNCQAVAHGLGPGSRNVIRQRLRHFGEQGQHAVLAHCAAMRKLAPVRDADACYVIVLANLH